LSDTSGSDFFAIQHVIPAQIAVPLSLDFALVGLVAICLIALTMMVRTVSRPTISQVLRLNED
ncbi:MAG TPA: hypothetical protein VFB12_19450, partial [Ktedonobacteraceae bacterium]|nr:hypothetical protein [Ktedonobacteraceae bacterium]